MYISQVVGNGISSINSSVMHATWKNCGKSGGCNKAFLCGFFEWKVRELGTGNGDKMKSN